VLIACEFFAKNEMITMDHSSYLPDLTPCDFTFFPKVKMIMRGEHFGDVENIKCETMRLLKNRHVESLKNAEKGKAPEHTGEILYKMRKNGIQMNDTCIDTHNPIFEIIQEENNR
jgi:hypothetical protein